MDFYDSEQWRDFDEFGDRGHPGGTAATRELILRAELTPGARLLDLCCGLGASVELLRAMGYDAMGIDRADTLSRARIAHPDCEFAVWDSESTARQLPCSDDELDAVLCECSLSVLEKSYADGLSAILAELRRVLKPGGVFIVSDVYDKSEGFPELAGFETRYTGERGQDLRDFAAQWLWDTGSRFPYDGDAREVSYYHGIYVKI